MQIISRPPLRLMAKENFESRMYSKQEAKISVSPRTLIDVLNVCALKHFRLHQINSVPFKKLMFKTF